MREISFTSPDEQEVWNTVRALNDSWTKGDGSGLSDYFHDDMVAITPVDKLRREGKQACMEGWMNFAKNCRTLYWNESEPRIQIYENTAIVTYYFDMAFETNGIKVESKGRDMFVFIRENGKWLAIADQFSPYP